jgi:lysophospholipase
MPFHRRWPSAKSKAPERGAPDSSMALEQLLALPDNPVPASGTCQVITAGDGVKLRTASWKPTGRQGSAGTVLVIHGRAEFIERWFETIQELRRRGFHVVSFDWRGQGGSDRLVGDPRKGHVRRFSDYQLDLKAVFDGPMVGMPQPHFVLAHSMGAALALEAATINALPVKRLVALAPMLALSMVERPAAAKAFAATLDWLGLGRSYVPGGGSTAISTKPYANNRLTTDAVRYARNAGLATAAPQLVIGDPTVRWAHEAFSFMSRMTHPNMPLAVKVPALIIGAGLDPIVSTPAVERFASRLKTGSALVIPDAKHEIVMETDPIRATFWAAFDAFVPGESIVLADEMSAA